MLTQLLKYRKSAGVAVTPRVHKVLQAANSARDARDFLRAAGLFRDALDQDPSLSHVWVQYGHMLREADEFVTAESAYNEALKRGSVSDPHLHLGHLYKVRGQLSKAAQSYLAAARADPTNGDALAELHRLMARGIEITPEDIMAITETTADDILEIVDPITPAAARVRSAIDTLAMVLRENGAEEDAIRFEDTRELLETLRPQTDDATESGNGEDTATAIVFDISDLISYFNNARLPTGIQRVQIEVISAALRQERRTVKICAFLEHRDEWVEISPAMFQLGCRLSLTSGDLKAPEWLAFLTKLRLAMTVSDAMAFPRGAFLVNLGTSWWLQNYFLYVRQAKTAYGIRYVPFVHDLIPVMASEHCTRELTQDFISWALGAFDHADFFLVNSEATKRDLLRVAALLEHVVDERNIVVVRLDADFRKPTTTSLSDRELSKWGLGRSEFVLFVSTIESRKNHIGAFDAWISLLRSHRPRSVPKLVCVGNKGWLNDAVYARLASHDGLRDKVVMLSGLSDAELDLLYRACLFTLYPSNYEGWGLPVTESLCQGKVPLLSDASSLPEAGGAFAHYFEAGSTPRLTKALEQLIFDGSFRTDKEALIRKDFLPRRWGDIAADIANSITERAIALHPGENAVCCAPVAILGAHHPIVRNFETRIWPGMRSAEIFRSGSGWWGPDNWGCWTKARGGALNIGIPENVEGPLRLYLRLHGLPTGSCEWQASVTGGKTEQGVIDPGAFKWVSLTIDLVPLDRCLNVTVEGEATLDLATVTGGLDPRIVSVGVAGFYLCHADDAKARSQFLEALALGNLDDLAYNRERIGNAAVAPCEA
ncbi:glycosyltransferase [Sphingobium sp. H39-3-25]|uniref:glycosyltransferase n=1 Tax=Sphingobium arseniciresistens TaxID=3030834 RepID=UPI0023B8EEC0|nr:glycosyltransferase [Sphingobium arseniciresistens]